MVLADSERGATVEVFEHGASGNEQRYPAQMLSTPALSWAIVWLTHHLPSLRRLP